MNRKWFFCLLLYYIFKEKQRKTLASSYIV
nr:MAG TPA: hypothetical protein [Caudoviricetes sp.]